MRTHPIDMYTSAVRLLPDGQVHDTPRTFEADRPGWFVMAEHAATDADVHADHWEVHPEAEELVFCLRGAFRIIIRARDREAEDEVAVRAGSAVIVPRGHWHRIELDEPSDLMAFTVLDGTRLAQA